MVGNGSFKNSADVTSPHLRFVSGGVLTALRGNNFQLLSSPEKWYRGFVFLPPSQVVRAYRLEEDGVISVPPSDKDPLQDVQHDRVFSKAPSAGGSSALLKSRSENLSPSLSSTKNLSSHLASMAHSVIGGEGKQLQLFSPSTYLGFTENMTSIRKVCRENGWEPVFHYTFQNLAPLILKTGLRMSTQGQGDGGVYVSVSSPASQWIGTCECEKNVIASW